MNRRRKRVRSTTKRAMTTRTQPTVMSTSLRTRSPTKSARPSDRLSYLWIIISHSQEFFWKVLSENRRSPTIRRGLDGYATRSGFLEVAADNNFFPWPRLPPIGLTDIHKIFTWWPSCSSDADGVSRGVSALRGLKIKNSGWKVSLLVGPFEGANQWHQRPPPKKYFCSCAVNI